MSRILRVLLSLAVVLVFASPAYAQGPVVQHSDPNWQAAYWNNMTLTGVPVLERAEASVDYDWATGSPGAGVTEDHFSARYTRYIDLAAGTYRFTVTADDGIRLWVDTTLVINQWRDQSASVFTGDVSLTEGHHLVKVEYYENIINAVVRVPWPPVLVTAGSWQGNYFNNTTLSGSPTLTRSDDSLNFNWGEGSPDASLPNDGFSVRWTRTVDFGSGSWYRFTACADDGVRLWVATHEVINEWRTQAVTCFTGWLYVSGSQPVQMEYYENTGLASASLTWATGSGPGPVPGSVLVDDTSAGFVKGGTASSWSVALEGYGGHLTWTRNDDYARYGYNYGRWYPSLVAGSYEVFVYIPERYTTTANARYWVSHRDGFTLRVVNQDTTGDQWVSLGTYWFRGTSADYVSLSDITYESYLSRLVAWDAMRWDPR